jgi:hypothetical protein
MDIVLVDELTPYARQQWRFYVGLDQRTVKVRLDEYLELVRKPRGRNWSTQGRWSCRESDMRNVRWDARRDRPQVTALMRGRVIQTLIASVRWDDRE